jgi:hypothetical protein
MRRVLSSCVFALVAAVSVSAQDTTIKSETRIKADDAKVMTVTGCLSGGPDVYVLNNVSVAQVPGTTDDDKAKKPVGTSGVAASYDLVSPQGLSLASHVGHKVEVVGVVVDPAKKGDDDAKIQIKERTEVQREDAPDSKVETTTKARIARGPSAQFAVTSLKSVSPICLQ